jgi:hypothetical protein
MMTRDEHFSTDTTDDGEDNTHYPPCPADSGCPGCSAPTNTPPSAPKTQESTEEMQDGGFVCGQTYILDEKTFKKWFGGRF